MGITGTKLIAAVAMSAILAAPALASSPVAGNYALADLGQGGWSGGPLFTNGTVGGGGGFSVSGPNGQEVAKVVGGTWSPLGSDAIHLCLDLAGIKNLPPTFTVCSDLPVTGTPVKITDPDGDQELVKVNLR